MKSAFNFLVMSFYFTTVCFAGYTSYAESPQLYENYWKLTTTGSLTGTWGDEFTFKIENTVINDASIIPLAWVVEVRRVAGNVPATTVNGIKSRDLFGLDEGSTAFYKTRISANWEDGFHANNCEMGGKVNWEDSMFDTFKLSFHVSIDDGTVSGTGAAMDLSDIPANYHGVYELRLYSVAPNYVDITSQTFTITIIP